MNFFFENRLNDESFKKCFDKTVASSSGLPLKKDTQYPQSFFILFLIPRSQKKKNGPAESHSFFGFSPLIIPYGFWVDKISVPNAAAYSEPFFFLLF